jgi:large subunit ribosomal protein L22
MAESKLQARGEKIKEKAEERAKEKQEAETKAAEGLPAKEEKKEETKPAPKKEVKKPVVTEAKGKSVFMPVSFKEAVMVCRAVKGMSVKKAEDYLEAVTKHERPVRYTRYNTDTPHRRGTGFGAGRFPAKTSKEVLKVLKNAAANAQYLNLDRDKLYIRLIKADRSLSKERRGRYSTVEVVVAESKEAQRKRLVRLKR